MKFITISRLYGAGGHTVGRAVAQKLGIEIYDRDIIRETADKMALTPDKVAGDEEKLSLGESFVRAITPVSYDMKDHIFDAEKQVIEHLAEKGPCVMLGRCAGVILKAKGYDVLDVLLYADEEDRAERVGELLGTTSVSRILKEMRKMDAQRNAYYTYYTGKKLTELDNWDLTLNTGSLGYDKCVEIICNAAE